MWDRGQAVGQGKRERRQEQRASQRSCCPTYLHIPTRQDQLSILLVPSRAPPPPPAGGRCLRYRQALLCPFAAHDSTQHMNEEGCVASLSIASLLGSLDQASRRSFSAELLGGARHSGDMAKSLGEPLDGWDVEDDPGDAAQQLAAVEREMRQVRGRRWRAASAAAKPLARALVRSHAPPAMAARHLCN